MNNRQMEWAEIILHTLATSFRALGRGGTRNILHASYAAGKGEVKAGRPPSKDVRRDSSSVGHDCGATTRVVWELYGRLAVVVGDETEDRQRHQWYR